MKAPARILAVLTTTLVVVGTTSATAWADAPVGGAWPEADQRSNLELFLYLGAATGGLFVVITLFGLLTARNNYVPPAPGSASLEQAPRREDPKAIDPEPH